MTKIAPDVYLNIYLSQGHGRSTLVPKLTEMMLNIFSNKSSLRQNLWWMIVADITGDWGWLLAAGLIMMMDPVTAKKHRKTHQQLRTLIHDQTQERDK